MIYKMLENYLSDQFDNFIKMFLGKMCLTRVSGAYWKDNCCWKVIYLVNLEAMVRNL